MLPAYAPEYFADRRIRFRIPYDMSGELVVNSGQVGRQFPESQFLHNVDKPFEIWRMISRVKGLVVRDDVEILVDPQPETMEERVRLSILDISKNQEMTKNPQRVSSMQKLNERTWEWAPSPYTIVRQEGFQVRADALALPTVCLPDLYGGNPACTLVPTTIERALVEVVFQGFLLIIEPPSESR